MTLVPQPRPWYWREGEKYVFLYDAEGVLLFAAEKNATSIGVARRAADLSQKYPTVTIDNMVDALFTDILEGRLR